MINSILNFSIKNKLFVGLFVFLLIIAGIWSITKVPIDAVPDITNNQVQVITQAPNLGTEDIEQFVTYPVEVAMANLPEVTEIRSISRFGLSVVTIVFEDGMGTYLPRQLVAEKLNQVKEQIPKGFGEPSMGPISTGLGEIYQYTLQIDAAFKDQYSATDLRTVQDWIIRRQMAMVPGVIEVNAFGGNIKQYEVAVDPDELRAIGLTISDIFSALEKNNQNTGGAYIEKDHHANFIRGEGLARSLEDIENIVIKNMDGLPITIKDVANVQHGKAVRYGAFTKDGKGEAVGGIIFMLKGANSNNVIEAVKQRIELIQDSLPEGISIEPFLDRSELISRTTSTVSQNLMEGALIVIFVLVLLLGNWRGGLIVASTIPLSLLFAFIMMNVFDVWANLMSLGAIDFGIIVDGAVIIVEGTVFQLNEKLKKNFNIDAKLRDKIAFSSSSRMMNSAFFGQLIILIVFIPILALEGVEGKMFKPMALTFIFAMIGVMILCLTYVPMMSSWFIRAGKTHKVSWGDRLFMWVENIYEPVLEKALKRGVWVVTAAILILGIAVFTFTRMGGEFIPQLDEGDIAFHVILKPGSSLSESIATSTKIEKMLLDKFPEIKHVMTRFGVSDVPTDPMSMDFGDCFVILEPKDKWASANSKDELINKMKEELSLIPGVNYEFTQPIEMRFNELLTGVREDIAVKLFGEDLNTLSIKAEEMGKIISTVEGVSDMKVEATRGLPQMTVNYNQNKLAQYGLHVEDLNTVVKTAFAGGKAGVIFEGEKRFDLVIRLDENYRKSIDDLKNLYINLSNGSQIPLKEVSEISYQPGPMQISRDNTNRRTYVGINVRGGDIKSVVQEIQQKLNAELDLPPGYYIRYGGAFENLKRATERLQIVVPIALGLIFVLIFFALKSFRQTAMIYIAIPLAAIGGVFSLWIRGMPFSISAGIGFIVLFGVAVLNGLVLINGWNELKEEGIEDLNKRIRMGAKRRIRPIILTASTDVLGFMPMALSNSAGAEVQRPLATVVIGGMITATLLTLIILPILYKWIESRGRTIAPKATAVLIIFLCISIFLPPELKARNLDNLTPVTLKEAIEKTKSAYPEIRKAHLEIENQEALKKTAWDLGDTRIFTGGEEIGGSNQGVYTFVGIQQQDIDLFGIAPKLGLQKERVALAEAALQLTEIELEYEVKKSYGNLYAAKKKYDLYLELGSVFEKSERAARLRYETEDTSKLEYLKLLNKSRKVTLDKEQALSDYRIALNKFNLWIADDSLYTVTDNENTEWSKPLPLDNGSILDHPRMEIAKQKVEVKAGEVKTAKKELLPRLNLLYGTQQVNGQTGFHQFQIGISMPLIFIKNQGQVESAKIKKQIAEQNLRHEQLKLKTAYQNALEEYMKWEKSWEFYKDEALPLANEQKKAAKISYKEGAIDYEIFSENIKEAMGIEIDGWNAFEKYLNSRYQLEYFIIN